MLPGDSQLKGDEVLTVAEVNTEFITGIGWQKEDLIDFRVGRKSRRQVTLFVERLPAINGCCGHH